MFKTADSAIVASRFKAWVLAPVLLVCGILPAQEYSFRYFGVADGLTNLTVRDVYQDRAGFLWVATINGFFRYDGERFEAFGPEQGVPSNPGAAFGDAPDGSLLAGGAFGLLHLRGNHFEKVPGPFKSVGETQGIQSDGKGHTYINTERGLMELSMKPDTDEFAVRPIPLPLGSAMITENGAPESGGLLIDGNVIWYGCGVSLCRIEDGKTRVYGAESGFSDYAIILILKDRTGTLWLRVRNRGIYVMPAAESMARRPILTKLDPNPIGIPSTDSTGQVFLQVPDGMLMGDEQGWRKIDYTSGLRGSPYRAFEDRQHNLWFFTPGRGAIQWRGYREWENYTVSSGLISDNVQTILTRADETIWVGVEGGLLRGKRESAGIEWKRVPALKNVNVYTLREGPDGAIWVGVTQHGIGRLDPRTGRLQWHDITKGLPRSVYDLHFDHLQRLWAGTDEGVFMALPPYKSFTSFPDVPKLRIRTIVEGNDGTIWAGGIGGFYSYSGNQWKHWTKADGLKDQQILSLGVGKDGAIWVAYRFMSEIDSVHLTPTGLAIERNVQRRGSDGIVYFIGSDARGRIWAGTDHGVDVLDGARWSHYGMSDGLVWDNCSQNAFAAEPDGTVWIGTTGGLSRFKQSQRQSLQAPIDVVFTQLLMGGADVTSQSHPSFDIHNNSLLAHYAALNATRENAVVFRYRMEGASSNWTETTQRQLQFAKLAPGDYKLVVEAQDGDGVWRARRAEFAFTILSPWYRRWWFFVICALIPLCGILGYFRLRMAAAARRELGLRQLVEAQKTIQNLAFFDPLTELPNRRMLLDRLRKTLAVSVRSGRLRALLFVDLDKFKPINDTLGHKIGDLLLKETARRLTASTRETDTVARLGGDEFVAILEDLSEQPEDAAAQAEMIAEKILGVIRQPFLLDGHECLLSSSIGITIFGVQPVTTEEVLQQADIAMYQSKSAGGDTARFFAPDLQTAINLRAALEEDLRKAIRQDQLLLYYQPQVDRERVIGAEALVRWMHPQHGLLFPDTFISLAEETGLILPLGDWVLMTACRQLAAWAEKEETADLSIAVNVSIRQLRQPDFAERVLETLELTGADPTRLELELTESMLVENIEETTVKMTKLRQSGIKFSLDDFGTGYSSLNYLRRLPLDRLKIDRAFVRDILVDACGGAIAQAIVSLSRAMGLPVMAEGVESEEQREYLANLGCHTYQGYLFSRPVTVESFEKLLTREKNIA
jgi:diguanylate cyclase (GGDEF)-like protein